MLGLGVGVGVGVGVRDAGLPHGLPGGHLAVAPGDEVSVLDGRPRLLRRQLQLDEHHVVADPQGQGQGRAARQEVTHLQTGSTDREGVELQRS